MPSVIDKRKRGGGERKREKLRNFWNCYCCCSKGTGRPRVWKGGGRGWGSDRSSVSAHRCRQCCYRRSQRAYFVRARLAYEHTYGTTAFVVEPAAAAAGALQCRRLSGKAVQQHGIHREETPCRTGRNKLRVVSIRYAQPQLGRKGVRPSMNPLVLSPTTDQAGA